MEDKKRPREDEYDLEGNSHSKAKRHCPAPATGYEEEVAFTEEHSTSKSEVGNQETSAVVIQSDQGAGTLDSQHVIAAQIHNKSPGGDEHAESTVVVQTSLEPESVGIQKPWLGESKTLDHSELQSQNEVSTAVEEESHGIKPNSVEENPLEMSVDSQGKRQIVPEEELVSLLAIPEAQSPVAQQVDSAANLMIPSSAVEDNIISSSEATEALHSQALSTADSKDVYVSSQEDIKVSYGAPDTDHPMDDAPLLEKNEPTGREELNLPAQDQYSQNPECLLKYENNSSPAEPKSAVSPGTTHAEIHVDNSAGEHPKIQEKVANSKSAKKLVGYSSSFQESGNQDDEPTNVSSETPESPSRNHDQIALPLIDTGIEGPADNLTATSGFLLTDTKPMSSEKSTGNIPKPAGNSAEVDSKEQSGGLNTNTAVIQSSTTVQDKTIEDDLKSYILTTDELSQDGPRSVSGEDTSKLPTESPTLNTRNAAIQGPQDILALKPTTIQSSECSETSPRRSSRISKKKPQENSASEPEVTKENNSIFGIKQQTEMKAKRKLAEMIEPELEVKLKPTVNPKLIVKSDSPVKPEYSVASETHAKPTTIESKAPSKYSNDSVTASSKESFHKSSLKRTRSGVHENLTPVPENLDEEKANTPKVIMKTLPKLGRKSEFPIFRAKDANAYIILSPKYQYKLPRVKLTQGCQFFKDTFQEEVVEADQELANSGLDSKSKSPILWELRKVDSQWELTRQPLTTVKSQANGNNMATAPRHVARLFHNLVSAIFQRPLPEDLNYYDSMELRDLAIKYGCADIVYLFVRRSWHLRDPPYELYQQAARDPPNVLLFAEMVQKGPLFKEAIVHLVGQIPEWEWNTPRESFIGPTWDLIAAKLRALENEKFIIKGLLNESGIDINGQPCFPGFDENTDLEDNKMTSLEAFVVESMWHKYCKQNLRDDAKKIGRFFRALAEGGEVYMDTEWVEDNLEEYRRRGWGVWDEVEQDLNIMKVYASKVVQGLVVHNSCLDLEEEEITWLTCTYVRDEELPWVKAN